MADGSVPRLRDMHYNTRVYSTSRLTLGERIKYLRAKCDPPMTQHQLSILSGVTSVRISQIENGDMDVNLVTLKKLAHGLGCQVFVNIKPQPSRHGGECLPLDHDLPPIPKLKRRRSAQAKRQAEGFGRSPWKKGFPKVLSSRPKALSDKLRSEQAALTGELPPTSPGKQQLAHEEHQEAGKKKRQD